MLKYSVVSDNIGKNIREVRKEIGYSQQKLAEICGFSNTLISQYETGGKNPGLQNIAILAKAMHVSIDRLVYGDENSAFINSELNDGKKIVNAIYFLWENGIIYYQNGESVEMSPYATFLGRMGYICFNKYMDPIKRLICALNEFRNNRDTFESPEKYLEILLSSVATEINKEIEKENL